MINQYSIAMWLIILAIVGISCSLLYRKGKIKKSTAISFSMLALYLSFVLTITIFGRTPSENYKYELDLFWSYKKAMNGSEELLMENFLNVILFVPIGLTTAVIADNKRLVLIAGAALSAIIEVTQFITKRGLFEFDDIIHNALGALLGLCLYLVAKKLFAALYNKSLLKIKNDK